MDKNNNCRSSCNRNSIYNNRRDTMAENTNCHALKTRFQQVEFAITETVLYLDAYPECKKALDYYHQLIDEREQLLSAINNQCGPITHFGNVSIDAWHWTSSPWPWKYEAN